MTPLLITFELPWIFTRLTPLALLDIFVVAVIFFWLLTVARGTRAMPLLRGIAILLGMIAVLSTTLNLTALRRLLEIAFPALVIAVPVIFQPELRRALEQLGQTRTWLNLPFAHTEEDIEKTIDEISRAVVQLSRQRIGALIVIERETGLQEYADRGVPEDAILTRQTLIQIFTPNTPLHDGAVIVRQNRILAAAVVLPLTEAPIGGTLGTRHRAAVGISEQSDAIAIVVSEETGQISMAMGGRLVRDLTHDKLKATLRARLRVDRDDHGDTGRPHLFSRGSRGLRKPRNPKTEATTDGERPAAD
jgi:diadenylate cyclase